MKPAHPGSAGECPSSNAHEPRRGNCRQCGRQMVYAHSGGERRVYRRRVAPLELGTLRHHARGLCVGCYSAQRPPEQRKTRKRRPPRVIDWVAVERAARLEAPRPYLRPVERFAVVERVARDPARSLRQLAAYLEMHPDSIARIARELRAAGRLESAA